MIPRKQFLYFLLDTPSGRAYYRDNGGTLQTLVIAAGQMDVTLKHAPGNWLDTLLEFLRNETYGGINRAYSTSMDFVKEVQDMIVELFLLGYGTEAALTLAVFKYNSQPQDGEPQYQLYFKGPLDLSKIKNKVLEGASINIMEGGAAQLLKNYENTIIQLPCDGSISENQKINFDGLLVPDVFHYQFGNFTNTGGARSIMPMTFINNEGDNYGIVRGTPGFENILSAPDPLKFFQDSTNYIMYSNLPIKVTLKGNIIVKSSTNNPVDLQLLLQTSAYPTTNPVAVLVPQSPLNIITPVQYTFTATVLLQPYEKLFMSFFAGSADDHLNVIGGGLSVSFSSQAKDTRAWAMTVYDALKLTWAKINELASTNGLNYNFPFESNLLQEKLNFFLTSGDALRASGDSTYQRFFNNLQIGQTLQNNFGPVIKVTIKMLYECIEVILKADIITGHNGKNETLYAERENVVFNPDVVDFSIGEVGSLEWDFDTAMGFSDLSLGYTSQTYDQLAGKYEYNTTWQGKAPINQFTKKLEKVTSVRTDSYGIEKLRSNTGQGISTTRNDSDNSVFLVNVDTSQWIYDFFDANFTSLITDPDNSNNTNIHIVEDVPAQPIQAPITDGEYFQPNVDNGIVVFAVPGYGATESVTLAIDGLLNSENKPPLAPTDSITIKLWYNGAVLKTYTVAVTSINTPISISDSFSQAFAYGGCIFITLETTATGVANLNTVDLAIGSYVSMNAVNIPVEAGTFRKLVSWQTFIPASAPWVTGTSVVQYGYQYFLYSSNIPNSNFNLAASVAGYIEGATNNFVIQCYINGVLQGSQIIVPGTVPRSTFTSALSANIDRAYTLGDIVFFTAYSTAPGLLVQVTNFDVNFTSDYIKAYSLKRVQYDSLTGIPSIATNAAGEIRTDIAGAPYNIEELTPGYLLQYIWTDYIRSCFFDKVRGDIVFQSLSKNPYLSYSKDGVTITESNNKNILTGKRLWYPITGTAKTNVPIGFAELMGNTVNAHIHATFMGNDFYFFANKLSQKPALNESQEWQFRFSAKTDLNVLAKITSFKIPDMADNSVWYSSSCPVQFVPYNQPTVDAYQTKNRNLFLFKYQVNNWLNQDIYGQPVMIGDPITLQFISNGLDPLSYKVFDCETDKLLYGPTNLDTIPAAAVPSPKVLWQKSIDTTGWDRANVYIVITGALENILKSEPLCIRETWELEDSILLQATSSFNTQGIVFNGNTPFTASMRFLGGFGNLFAQKYMGKFYVDQPQDISVLNAIPYETATLLTKNIPDYAAKKLMRLLLLDGAMLDGEGFTLNEGAELEQVFTKGAPMKLQRVEIRPSTAITGINVALGQLDTDNSLIVSVNPQSFGPNITNASGTTETDLIGIVVSP